MDRHDKLTKKQYAVLMGVVADLKEAHGRIESARFELQKAALDGVIGRGKGLDRMMAILDNIDSALNGQAYMFTPQTEWLGGDDSCFRWPHIVRDQL